MQRARPTVVLEGDLILGRKRLKKVDAAFLEAYCEHFQQVGHGIFDLMYERFPSKYFEGLIVLAKAGMPLHVKHELGAAEDFDDSPSKVDEALDKAEERGGPAARAMLKRMLNELAEAEKKYLEDKTSADTEDIALIVQWSQWFCDLCLSWEA
jgi:hypothetical protein